MEVQIALPCISSCQPSTLGAFGARRKPRTGIPAGTFESQNLQIFLEHIFKKLTTEIVMPSVRLSIRPSVHPSVCPSVRLSIRPSVHPSICPSVRLSIRPSVHPSVCPSVRLSIRPSVHPSVNALFLGRYSTWSAEIWNISSLVCRSSILDSGLNQAS
jgi:hypothetical protein